MAILIIKDSELAVLARDNLVATYSVVSATKVDVVADVLIADGGLVLLKNSLSYPTFLIFHVTDGDAGITALDATIVGVGIDEVTAVTESVSLDNAGAGGTIIVSTTNQYASVTSITLDNAAGNGAGDNVSVGTSLDAAADFDIPRGNIFTTAPASDDWITVPEAAYSLNIDMFTDAAGDAGGFVVEHSMDGVTVHSTNTLTDGDGSQTIAGGSLVHHSIALPLSYFRLRYQNATTAQVNFQLNASLSARVVDTNIDIVASGTSAAGDAQTVTLPATPANIREVDFVTIKYSADQTANVSITINSHLGSDFDTLIQLLAFAADTDAFIQFTPPLRLAEGDSLDVLCPLLAAETSSVTIYAREVS